jgi:mono/diheme cytochrome c family protein
MKKPYLILIFLFAGILLVLSCQHEIQFPSGGGTGTDTTTQVVPPPAPPPSLPPPIAGSTCSPDTVYFSNTILPLLSSNCAMSGCHNGLGGGDAAQYTLNTYAGIKAIVKAGNPGSSKLVSVISNGSMPPRGHTPITSAQLTAIKTWISQGALNNTCSASTCDTANVSFSVTISTILQNNCTGCHSGSAPSGAGIDLTAYANVLTQVKNGKLWGDVSHSTGYNAMPLGGATLSACDLNMISAWINKGAPNN